MSEFSITMVSTIIAGLITMFIFYCVCVFFENKYNEKTYEEKFKICVSKEIKYSNRTLNEIKEICEIKII